MEIHSGSFLLHGLSRLLRQSSEFTLHMRVFVSVTFSGSGSDLKEPVIRLNNIEPFSISMLGQK